MPTSSNTLYVQFNPDPKAGQQFSFTGVDLNGQTQVYTMQSWYNHFSNRYYLRVFVGGDTFALPLISSPDNYDIPLNSGYLLTPIVFRGSTLVLEIG
ncbi:MAG: hypothetical protein V4807_12265 [Burkholderia gladioli]|uniref:hypothetical protein n=1 Tax=Burkholderia gladioli TaxID=28095 RepID=UPI002866817A|nr:hypothetical protein [Burkholderia gladioli]MDR8091088.1 hypothetical protein [Burkholderia gladioli]